MKIIDLLNKIANDEEVPKYVRYRDISKHEYNTMMVCKENIIYQIDQCVIDLNDEVEILEEKKKIPEKLEIYKITDETISGLRKSMNVLNKDIASKINEIIDYLKNKGE